MSKNDKLWLTKDDKRITKFQYSLWSKKPSIVDGIWITEDCSGCIAMFTEEVINFKMNVLRCEQVELSFMNKSITIKRAKKCKSEQ